MAKSKKLFGFRRKEKTQQGENEKVTGVKRTVQLTCENCGRSFSVVTEFQSDEFLKRTYRQCSECQQRFKDQINSTYGKLANHAVM